MQASNSVPKRRALLDGVVAGRKVDGVLLGAVGEVVEVVPHRRLDAVIQQPAICALACKSGAGHHLNMLSPWDLSVFGTTEKC